MARIVLVSLTEHGVFRVRHLNSNTMKFLDRVLDELENFSTDQETGHHDRALIFVLVGFVSLIALTALI
ncbi:hypothetical protein [Methylococcus geothermalis]|uniref:Uncharacterized protein n=1 Tax=Methylococcus geothermalis TaxID=2681310 RepID=A0A858Q7N8_9GAMM|nr:hypothetical protein [Methylococcus geothermalis]QJD29837.1 hypothetical protein GNH96_07535 [Methylococcus geothermalis]